MNTCLLFTILCGILLLYPSCSVAPPYRIPEVSMPVHYKNIGQWHAPAPSDHVQRGNWWKIFKDPVLSKLMDELNTGNLDIVMAEARYRQSEALLRQTAGSFLPQIDAGLTTQSSHSTSAKNSGNISNNYDLQAAASWDADLWGKIRSRIAGAAADTDASKAELESVRLSMQTQLAMAYFEIRILDTQRDFYAKTIESYRQALHVTSVRFKQGVDSPAAVMQAETQLKSTEAQAIELDITRNRLENSIAVLLGKSASSFSLPQQSNWDAILPNIPAGIPTTLLQRRPDVAAAERAVASANARIGETRAALYPSFIISSNARLQQTSFGNWLSSPNTGWSIGADFIGPVFDGGTRRAAVSEAEAAYDEAVANYKNTVLNSIREVEDSLAALNLLDDKAAAQEAALKAAIQSEDTTSKQYRAGKINYLDVVTVQAITLTNERNAAEVRNTRYIALIQLIRALGGTW